jgi:hypothetical protein
MAGQAVQVRVVLVTRISVALVAVVVVAAACTATPLPSLSVNESGHVELRTLAPERDQSPAACMAALLTATLVRHPNTGLGLRSDDGHVIGVIWPFGYSARDDGGRLAVVDRSGKVLAHEFDTVSVAGGFAGDETLLTGCGGITSVAVREPS